MALSLDHLVISVHDLDTAIADYRDLGFTVTRGGIHASRATHNALIVLADGTYLELMAPTGHPPLPGVADYSPLLQHGEGLVGLALNSENLEAEAARLRAEGFAVGEITPGERRRPDGTVIGWKLALLGGGYTPFLIQDVTPREWRVSRDPALTTHPNGAAGLRAVEIAVRDPAAAGDTYARLFGVPPQPTLISATTLGCVILHAASAGELEGLFRVHLVCARAEGVRFPPERTHGVRFVAVTY